MVWVDTMTVQIATPCYSCGLTHPQSPTDPFWHRQEWLIVYYTLSLDRVSHSLMDSSCFEHNSFVHFNADEPVMFNVTDSKRDWHWSETFVWPLKSRVGVVIRKKSTVFMYIIRQGKHSNILNWILIPLNLVTPFPVAFCRF